LGGHDGVISLSWCPDGLRLKDLECAGWSPVAVNQTHGVPSMKNCSGAQWASGGRPYRRGSKKNWTLKLTIGIWAALVLGIRFPLWTSTSFLPFLFIVGEGCLGVLWLNPEVAFSVRTHDFERLLSQAGLKGLDPPAWPGLPAGRRAATAWSLKLWPSVSV
jgi:hypothetical protein